MDDRKGTLVAAITAKIFSKKWIKKLPDMTTFTASVTFVTSATAALWAVTRNVSLSSTAVTTGASASTVSTSTIRAVATHVTRLTAIVTVSAASYKNCYKFKKLKLLFDCFKWLTSASATTTTSIIRTFARKVTRFTAVIARAIRHIKASFLMIK